MIVLFYEHYQREYYFLNTIKKILVNKGLKVLILHFYSEFFICKIFSPQLAVVPFFYSNKDKNCLYLLKNNIKIINLAWEQTLYPLKEFTKKPTGLSIDRNVFHFSWGKEYYNRLINSGCIKENIIISGNYNLYMINRYLKKKNLIKRMLSRKYNLSLNKKWIFIPENYSWAMMHPGKVKTFKNYDSKSADNAIKTTANSLTKLFNELEKIDQSFFKTHEIIFRVRPSIRINALRSFLYNHNILINPNIKFISDDPFFVWGISSDFIISNLSTILLDFSFFKQNTFLYYPDEIEQGIRYEWLEMMPKIKKIKLTRNNETEYKHIRKWIESEMPLKDSAIILVNTILNLNIKNNNTSNKLISYILIFNYYFNKYFGELIRIINRRSINYFSDLRNLKKRLR